MSEQEQVINNLKVRCFDAEEAASSNKQLVEQLISFVATALDLEDVKSVEDFAKKVNEKFPAKEDFPEEDLDEE